MTYAFSPSRRLRVSVDDDVWAAHPDTGAPTSMLKMFVAGRCDRFPTLRPGPLAQIVRATTPSAASLKDLAAAVRANVAELHRAGRHYGFRVLRDPVPARPFAVGSGTSAPLAAGMTVRVGLGGPDDAVRALGVLRAYLPALLFVSARSPQRLPSGGYASYRFARIAERGGRLAPPPIADWTEFLRTAKRDGFLGDAAACTWLARVTADGDIEMRACDVQADWERTLAIAAATRMIVRAALTGDIQPQVLATGTAEDWLTSAAMGRWSSLDLSDNIKRLAARRGHKEDGLYALRLFPRT